MSMIVADNCFPECELELAMIDDLQLLVEEEMYKRKQESCKNIYKSIRNSLIRSLLFDLFGLTNCDKLQWDEYWGIGSINNGLYNCSYSNFYPLLRSNNE